MNPLSLQSFTFHQIYLRLFSDCIISKAWSSYLFDVQPSGVKGHGHYPKTKIINKTSHSQNFQETSWSTLSVPNEIILGAPGSISLQIRVWVCSQIYQLISFHFVVTCFISWWLVPFRIPFHLLLIYSISCWTHLVYLLKFHHLPSPPLPPLSLPPPLLPLQPPTPPPSPSSSSSSSFSSFFCS